MLDWSRPPAGARHAPIVASPAHVDLSSRSAEEGARSRSERTSSGPEQRRRVARCRGGAGAHGRHGPGTSTDPASAAAPPSRRAALLRSGLIVGVLFVVFVIILPRYVDYAEVAAAFRR